MRIFRQLDELPTFHNAVLTIGSFDGVHLGHQQLLARINGLAQERDGESIVITFHPHPRQVIYPNDDSLVLLTTTEEKLALFRRYGVDNVVVVPFTVAFSQQSADEYIQRFLVEKFQPSVIVIGYDHKFGLNRQGDLNYLKWHSKAFEYAVEEIAAQEVDDMAVSSTKVRRALQAGRVEDARRWLGHAYTLAGKVVKGQQLGRQLGFPTANIQVRNRHKLIPADGVYAVRVQVAETTYDGMLYIGERPSIEGVTERVIEVNIFAFQADIYDQDIRVTFYHHLRGDTAFDSLEGLKNQLAQDQDEAQRLLETLPAPAPPNNAVDGSVAIVILNYNGADYLRAYLPTVLDSIAKTDYRVIVADNASTDDSLAVMSAEFPQVAVIAMPKNLGFAAGYNQALAQVSADYLVLLNSDVKVTPNWLAPCLEALAAPDVAACQPKVKALERPEQFEYAGAAGGWLDSLGYPFCRGRIFATTEQDNGQYDRTAEIFWATGAALFIKAELFRNFGGFDGEYFAHAEEIDLCWRLKRAGYRILAVPESEVYHLGGGTLDYLSPRKAFLNFRNTLITSFKNEVGAKLFWWLPLRLVMDGLAGVLF
ncbi:MAG: bifunctional riboflavin kinase/FAD synthetase, partial [Bacteroidota bacterium]